METSDTYNKYVKLMANFAPTFLNPLVEEKLKDTTFFSEQIGVEFSLFNGFSEISSSLDTLKLIESFINIEPILSDEINFNNYLTYHIHNYLQEMYIFKDRLDKYIKFINSTYKNTKGVQLLNDIETNLLKIVKSTLKNITVFETGARSKHVHYSRFQDEELKWLSSTTLLADFHEEFQIESENAYKTAKNKWYKIIKNNNIEVIKLLDIIFDTIYLTVSIDDKVFLPKEGTKNAKTK